ncbi:DoxX family protein [soil metagenome]
MARNTFLFGSLTGGDRNTDVGLAVVRVTAGLALAFLHGIGKIPPSEGFTGMVGGMGFPAPVLFAWLAALAEFAGGILIAIGLLTRPAAAFVAVHFVIVTLIAHAGDTMGDRELPLMFFSIAVLFALAGAGRYSVDALIGRSKTEV